MAACSLPSSSLVDSAMSAASPVCGRLCSTACCCRGSPRSSRPWHPGGGAGGGLPLNVNADDAAAATAGALQAAELLFVSDVPGVVVKGAPQPSLPVGELDTLIELGIAANGMAAKLRAAAAALEAGARAVRIGDLRLLSDPTAGTRILATTPQPA